MHSLHVALQDGFAHDAIDVTLDGASVFTANDISTRQQIGLAASFDIAAKAGAHSVEVRLPRRHNVSGLQKLKLDSDTWLGVSLRNGHIEMRVSPQPFGYM